MAKTTVHRGDNGQYKTTVPKALAEALELAGERVEWRIKSANTLELTKEA